ncbi:zf-C3HC domain containing protein [Amanita muscaria]
MDKPTDAIRSTKRKLEQAFYNLDAAVTSSDSLQRPPSKRAHSSRSLYSTLAKYGVKIKDTKRQQSTYNLESLSKSTPHLSAILSRAAVRTKNALSLRPSHSSLQPSLLDSAEYRPSSVSSFLSRLASYKLSTYANKPSAIDAVAAAKCGWINDGRDRLVCGICKSSWVVVGREGMSREAANTLIEKQRVSLVEVHKEGCPWKSRQCDDSIYRIPLKPPAAMLKTLKQNAIILHPLLEDVVTKHPLTSKQVHSLRDVTLSFSLSSPWEPHDHEAASASRSNSPSPEDSCLSDNAILASLFGWSIVPFTALESSSRRTSLSRASSVAPSNASRAPSIPSATNNPYYETPSTLASISMVSLNRTNTLSRENTMLYCLLCQRRVGLWAFAPQTGKGESTTQADTSPRRKATPQRPFDLLKEHRSFCPYVVRSTPVPSLPATQGQEIIGRTSFDSDSMNVEGWRAILTIVLRYGIKQRVVYDILNNQAPTQNTETDEPTEVDNVKAMVTNVKSRGGRDLLKYVRSLLG